MAPNQKLFWHRHGSISCSKALNNKKRLQPKPWPFYMPGTGLEPVRAKSSQDFKSCVSANSTTPALSLCWMLSGSHDFWQAQAKKPQKPGLTPCPARIKVSSITARLSPIRYVIPWDYVDADAEHFLFVPASPSHCSSLLCLPAIELLPFSLKISHDRPKCFLNRFTDTRHDSRSVQKHCGKCQPAV